MDEKERKRQQYYDRVADARTRANLYLGRSAYDVAKEQSKLERQANKILQKGATWKNGNHHVNVKKK